MKLKDFNKYSINSVNSTTYHYQQLIISFGFISLFSITFPLITIVYWITNLLDQNSFKYTLLNESKRPYADGVKNIGKWELALKLLVIISIFTNCGIFIFTTNCLHFLSSFSKIVTFFTSTYMFLIIYFVFEYLIAERDDNIKVGEFIKREKYLKEKMVMLLKSKELYSK